MLQGAESTVSEPPEKCQDRLERNILALQDNSSRNHKKIPVDAKTGRKEDLLEYKIIL